MKAGPALMVVFPLVLLTASFVLSSTRGARAAGPSTEGLYWDDGLAEYVRRRIVATYVDEVDPERAERAFYRALDAYVRELDEYCDVIPPLENQQQKEHNAGEYAGLGVRIDPVEEGLVIVGILPGAPAAKAGLRVGDTIVAADGRSLARESRGVEAFTRWLKGEAGSGVTLRIVPGPRVGDRLPDRVAREVVVIREVVRPPTVFVRRLGSNGEFVSIRLTDFADATAEDFSQHLDQARKDGVQGVVLDLRGNPGGVLNAALRIADRFLSQGTIVRMEGRAEGASREHLAGADPDDVPDSVPVLVLVDGGSASASEVLAGALQDHRRALIVGERTYGKFLVQQVSEIPGRNAGLKLTTSRYYTPSGRSYQRRSGDAPGAPAGLVPDIVVSLGEEDRKTLALSWVREEALAWGEQPRDEEVDEAWIDPQLRRALDVLEGRLVLQRIRGR